MDYPMDHPTHAPERRSHRRGVDIGIALFVTVACTVIFGATLMRAAFYAPEEEIPLSVSPSASGEVAPGSLPERLIIPSLGIDAAVQRVGIAESGNMAVTASYRDVGWYRLGTVPGAHGSAVMAGHLDNGFGFGGVFKDLDRLRDGERIIVRRADGTELVFRVESRRSYPYLEVPAEAIFNGNDAIRLNLITCGGAWISEKKTYDRRLVVFATLKNEKK